MKISRIAFGLVTLSLILAAGLWFGRSGLAGSGAAPAGGLDPAGADSVRDGSAALPDAPSDAAPASRRSSAALPVGGAVVRRGPFVLDVHATGRAEAERRAELSLPLGERVRAVTVSEGDRVAAGRTLVELDRAPFEIARQEAAARLATAETDFRIQLLSETEVSEERRAFAEHRSGVTEARAGVARAELDLAATRLSAPFAGSVVAVNARVGERALANETLVTLVDLDRIRIRAEVLESDFGCLRVGAAARVRVPAFPAREFAGEVVALGPEVDAERGAGIVYVRVENPGDLLKPGMFAELNLAGTVYDDRVSVPRDAILERDGRLLVFRAADGRAEWEYVTTGLETSDRVEITSGVAAGDTVLVNGHLTLAHGAPVRVTVEP